MFWNFLASCDGNPAIVNSQQSNLFHFLETLPDVSSEYKIIGDTQLLASLVTVTSLDEDL